MEERKRLEREINSRLSSLNTDYETLLKKIKKDSASLKRKNQELEREIAKIKNENSKRSGENSDQAADSLRNAGKILRVVENKPHEKFLPGRFKIYSNSLKDGRHLFQIGLFEAAAAVGISVKNGLERFNLNIDDKIKEWEKNFKVFKLKLENLREKVNNEISAWSDVIGKKIRTEIIDDINFWSRGGFLEIVDFIKTNREILKEISQTGLENYIKNPESPSIDELEKIAGEIDEAEKNFSNLSVIFKARYYSACERSEMGEKIIDFFTTEINLEWRENLSGYHENDFREWLKIIFENSSNDKICVYIIPIENKNNNKIENHVILHIEYNGAAGEIYSQNIHEHLREALENFESEIELANDIESLKFSSDKSLRETAKDIEKTNRN